MTWTRIDDDFNDRPENALLGRSARLLKVEALVWCNKVLSDGVLPEHMVRRITDSEDLDRDVAELVKGGHWTRLDADDGWQVSWKGQETAERVNQRRADHAASQRAYEERKRLHAQGIHTKCHAIGCEALRRHTSRDTSDDQSLTAPVPSRPVPTRRGGTGTEDREGSSAASDGGSAGAPPAAASAAPPPDHPWKSHGMPPGGIPTVNGVPVVGPGAKREEAQ